MKIKVWFLGLAFVCSFGQMAGAGLIQYVTPTGSTTSGGSVSGEADFTLGNGSLTLTLTNYTADPTADSQMINGITFNITGASSEELNSSLGKTATITQGSAATNVSSSPVSLTHWTASETGTKISLSTLSGGKPDELIIGPGGNGGIYNNANSSITGHGPSVLNTATFTFDITGITASSTLSNVVLDFGTTSGSDTVALSRSSSSQPAAVPEPSSLALLGIGGLAMAIGAYRRGRKRAA